MGDGPSICRLCGSTTELLTLEHTPPKSAGNRGAVELECLTLEHPAGRMTSVVEDGVATRTLCASCNNNYGRWIGSSFASFAKQVRRSGSVETLAGGVFVSAVKIYPSRVIRQLLLSFLCIHPNYDSDKWAAVREYICDREGTLPSDAPRISLYFNRSEAYRVVPVCAVGALGKGIRWSGAEMAAPGLGVLYSLGGSERDLPPLIQANPMDVSEWGDLPFTHRETVALRVPRLQVADPHPIGFGTRREVQRWQERMTLVWGVAEAADPASPISIAAIWKPSRRSRRK